MRAVAKKTAYQRPYKTRGQRREMSRRKHDDNTDHKFLIRMVVIIGLLVLVAVLFLVQNTPDDDSIEAVWLVPVLTQIARAVV